MIKKYSVCGLDSLWGLIWNRHTKTVLLQYNMCYLKTNLNSMRQIERACTVKVNSERFSFTLQFKKKFYIYRVWYIEVKIGHSNQRWAHRPVKSNQSNQRWAHCPVKVTRIIRGGHTVQSKVARVISGGHTVQSKVTRVISGGHTVQWK